ncbi:MAG: branched-chain amino acid ABC transporter permease [Actinomycetota bacterium]|nr:branched-chain amino acid ABC transporter permease [Actinomycetota bacterium]
MSDFLQQVVSGLASGGIFASLALALVLIYRATRVINFAQGEMATVSTFVAWSLVNRGMPFWGAFFLTLALAFVGGVALERIVIRPVENASVLTVVIVTLGLAILLNGFSSVQWGSEVKKFPSPFPTRPIHVGGVAFSIQDLGVIGVSIALVLALGAFFRFTKLGLAMRAAALNPDASRLVGVRVSWMLALGWGLAAMLGAVSGMMIAPVVFLDPNMMQTVLLYALAAAILGGMDSAVGAVVGGLALGVILNLTGAYVDFIGGTLRLPVALGVILLVLLVRPSGLFGRAAVRKV